MENNPVQDDVAYIEEQMRKNCEEQGFFASKNLPKIARAKNMMFGKENWRRCPCDGGNPNRYCGSELCSSDVANFGVCHCNCFFLVQEDADK